MSNKIKDSEFSLSKLIYKFDANSLKQCDDEKDNNVNNKEKINANRLKANRDNKNIKKIHTEIINYNNNTPSNNNINNNNSNINNNNNNNNNINNNSSNSSSSSSSITSSNNLQSNNLNLTLHSPRMDRRNAINFKHNNNLDDDNSAVNSLILETIQSSLEKNSNDMNLIRAISIMPTRFKEAFEAILKTNRIEDYDETQNFFRIQDRHSKENRFVDYSFRPNDKSIFFTEDFKNWLISQGKANYRNEIVWKRAKDLCHNAQFAVNEAENQVLSVYHKIDETNYKNFFHTTDLDQGCLGNCWFISAATGIIQNFNLFKRVVCLDNSFDDSVYTGAFHFRFWLYGTWKDVVIDDYLPVGPDNRLIFCKNRDTKNEFWCALLEKAYAKVCGSYESLEGGFTTDALIDMSGGIEEIYNLVSLRKSLSSSRSPKAGDIPTLDHRSFWSILIEARKKFSVVGCNIELENSYKGEVKLSNGLVQGHAYIITKVAEIEKRDRVYRLIRLYNPWGNDCEWNGDWSDRSPLWSLFDKETREKLELRVENDGEFWMSYEDWLRNFDNCQICNLTPDTINDINESDWENSRLLSNIFSMWQCQMFHGQWIKEISAGGRGQYDEAKYWTNPQYTFIINESDVIKDDSCWVIIGLMQKFTRQKRIELKSDSTEEYIQFRLYKVKDTETFFKCISSGEHIDSTDLQRVSSSGSYTNKREVTGRFSLKVGAYVIVPSCYDEDVEGDFLIRIFTEKPLSKKSLVSSGRRPTVQYKSKQSSFDEEEISRDIQSLSTGASNVFQKFIHIASDFSKLATKNKKFKESKIEREDSYISASDDDDEDDDDNKGVNRLNINLGPRISCNPS